MIQVRLSRFDAELLPADGGHYLISSRVLNQGDWDFGFLPQTMTIDAVLDEV